VDADNRLTFKLALTDNPQQRVRLEVRWEAEPATLAKGAADYLVEVRAGGDALAEKTVTHAARGPQKCVFTQDDFGDLEGSERFEAEVVIRALTAEALLTDDAEENPYCAKSEDFILCFGATDQPAKSSAGNVFPSLALAAIQVAKDAETFKRLADNPATTAGVQRRQKRLHRLSRGRQGGARAVPQPAARPGGRLGSASGRSGALAVEGQGRWLTGRQTRLSSLWSGR
jgi:DNA phosphorothioation-dependent restriction protein DptH